MINKLKTIFKIILFGLAVCFSLFVFAVMFFMHKESNRKAEDMAHRAADPVYKAQAEEKDRVDMQAEANARTYKEVEELMKTSDKRDRERLILEKETNESNQKETKKLQEAIYKEQVDRDAERMLAVEKYAKDVAEAADKKR
ncbi:hypothetical protein [Polaromonas sp.]|uniref:hypothetical protein n=1 Tax=Polaromonas sp. TaxID=1869339 RepID=UPI0013BD664E|nr:hypothetical protein [Polaromonas sp.]NDP64789.1 hypothetical protein [Polaromonas sp.]